MVYNDVNKKITHISRQVASGRLKESDAFGCERRKGYRQAKPLGSVGHGSYKP